VFVHKLLEVLAMMLKQLLVDQFDFLLQIYTQLLARTPQETVTKLFHHSSVPSKPKKTALSAPFLDASRQKF